MGTDNRNDALSWRITLGEYENSQDEKARYYGMGAEYDGDEVAFQAELFTQNIELGSQNPYGGYLQSTWHFDTKQDVVLRFENYRDEVKNQESIYLFDYLYRPRSNIAIKGEYVKHSKLPLNRFLFSLSVLF